MLIISNIYKISQLYIKKVFRQDLNIFTFGGKKISLKTRFRRLFRKKRNFVYKITAVLVLIIYILIFEYLMIRENQFENANPITALYWATSTYGNVVFNSQAGRLFSVIVQISGIILISGFLVTYIVTPWMDRVIKFRLPRKASQAMNLKILLPFQIFAEKKGVSRIVAESREGSFGLLPHRLDCVASLEPGILTYETEEEGEVYVAVDEGILIKTGQDVLVSVRDAIFGTELSQLKEAVEKEFLTLDENEQKIRSVMVKLETGLIRRLAEFQNG